MVIWVLERENSRRSHIRWIWWFFDDIRWVFGQKYFHNDSLVRWSFGTSRVATRFMPKQSFQMVRIDLCDTKSSAATPLKLKWRFSITISFTLAMFISVEDVDGRPERDKSSTTSRPLLNALYYSYPRVFDKVDFDQVEQTKWQIALELYFSTEDSGDNLASKGFLTISLSGLSGWSIPGTFLTECIQ